MDEEIYRKTVIQMRAHQDAWFRRHAPSDLIEAKRLEKLIDVENKRWFDEQKSSPTHFDKLNAAPTLPILDEHQNGEGVKQGNLFE